MNCPIYEGYHSADPTNAEVMAMVVDDPEGYEPVFAATVLSDLTELSSVVHPYDVIQHRGGDCSCGGVLVRDNEG